MTNHDCQMLELLQEPIQMPVGPPNTKTAQDVVNNHGMKPVNRIIPRANTYKSQVPGTLPRDHFSTGSRKLVANPGV